MWVNIVKHKPTNEGKLAGSTFLIMVEAITPTTHLFGLCPKQETCIGFFFLINNLSNTRLLFNMHIIVTPIQCF